ncbi:hypothetical protein [Ramlibacter alkalitolerans]|uniref:ShET2 enterotoxin N-terminal domain-containing protein n=1 Tax=Ramlibacter alkalitolerans TaxID=2039631 RepID=A0ABS1JU51_9BURK|nr:hypothetical protein [Ramlibacter alkalitolerans]MBL0427820.1 hypothetical protein [Ramlibacter alkalitolerans]
MNDFDQLLQNIEALPVVDADAPIPARAVETTAAAPVAFDKANTVQGQTQRLMAALKLAVAGLPAGEPLEELAGRQLVVSPLVEKLFTDIAVAATHPQTMDALAQIDTSLNSTQEFLRGAVNTGSETAMAKALPYIGGAKVWLDLHPHPNFFDALCAQPVHVQELWVGSNFDRSPKLTLRPGNMPMGDIVAGWKRLPGATVESGAHLAVHALHAHGLQREPPAQWCQDVQGARRALVQWMRETLPWDRPSRASTPHYEEIKALNVWAANKRNQLELVVRHLGSQGALSEDYAVAGFMLRADPVRALDVFAAAPYLYERQEWQTAMKSNLSAVTPAHIEQLSPAALTYLASLGDARVAQQRYFERALDGHPAHEVVEAFNKCPGAPSLVLHGTVQPKNEDRFDLLRAIEGGSPLNEFHGRLGFDTDNLFKLLSARPDAGQSIGPGYTDGLLRLVTPEMASQRASDGSNILHCGTRQAVAIAAGHFSQEQLVQLMAEKNKDGKTPGFCFDEHAVKALAQKAPNVLHALDPFQKYQGVELWKVNDHLRHPALDLLAKRGEHLKATVVGRSADAKTVYVRVAGCNGKDYSKKVAQAGVTYNFIRYDEKKQAIAAHLDVHSIDLAMRHNGASSPLDLLGKRVQHGMIAVLSEYDKRGCLDSLKAKEPAAKKSKAKDQER